MKQLLTRNGLSVLGLVAACSTSWAHGGHVAEAGHGHSHWLAVAALGAIAIVGLAWLWKRIRYRRDRTA